jgi:hypothetical protein
MPTEPTTKGLIRRWINSRMPDLPTASTFHFSPLARTAVLAAFRMRITSSTI